MPHIKLEIGPGEISYPLWRDRDDVLFLDKSEQGLRQDLAAIPEGSLEEVYMGNFLGCWEGSRKSILDWPRQVGTNYKDMVILSFTLHALLKPGGTITIVEDKTPVPNPDYNIVEPLCEKNRFIVIEREEIPLEWPVQGYRLVLQKPFPPASEA